MSEDQTLSLDSGWQDQQDASLHASACARTGLGTEMGRVRVTPHPQKAGMPVPSSPEWRMLEDTTGQFHHQSHGTQREPASEMLFTEGQTTQEGPIPCSAIKIPEGEGGDLPMTKENTVPFQ